MDRRSGRTFEESGANFSHHLIKRVWHGLHKHYLHLGPTPVSAPEFSLRYPSQTFLQQPRLVCWRSLIAHGPVFVVETTTDRRYLLNAVVIGDRWSVADHVKAQKVWWSLKQALHLHTCPPDSIISRSVFIAHIQEECTVHYMNAAPFRLAIKIVESSYKAGRGKMPHWTNGCSYMNASRTVVLGVLPIPKPCDAQHRSSPHETPDSTAADDCGVSSPRFGS